MQKEASVAKFDVACDPEHIKWMRSDKGHKALQEAQKEAEKFISKLEAERSVTHEMLKEPFTI